MPTPHPPLPNRAPRARHRSKLWPLLPISLGVLFPLLAFHSATDREFWTWWTSLTGWNSTAMWPMFYDLSITLEHLREADAGMDPLGDPESEFAYPRAVLALRHLGLHHLPAEWLGLLQGLVLTFAVVLVMRPVTRRRAFGTSLLLFCPPILMGIDRGNLDFALFVLCAAAAWLWAQSKTAGSIVWPAVALMVGALLKLYPFFGLVGAALADGGKRRQLWLSGGALIAGYWYLSREELSLVMEKIPITLSESWGCLVFFSRLTRHLTVNPDLYGMRDFGWIASSGLVVYAIGGMAAAGIGFRFAGAFRSIHAHRTEWCYYWVGAAIACGSFMGANIAYRWVLVLLTIPMLLRNVRNANRTVATWARIALGSVLISLAAPLQTAGVSFALLQLVNWIYILSLVVGCSALLKAKADERRNAEAPLSPDAAQPQFGSALASIQSHPEPVPGSTGRVG